MIPAITYVPVYKWACKWCFKTDLDFFQPITLFDVYFYVILRFIHHRANCVVESRMCKPLPYFSRQCCDEPWQRLCCLICTSQMMRQTTYRQFQARYVLFDEIRNSTVSESHVGSRVSVKMTLGDRWTCCRPTETELTHITTTHQSTLH